MDRRISASRAELIERLRELCEGWDHFGEARLAEQGTEAIAALQQGAPLVQVGWYEYKPVD